MKRRRFFAFAFASLAVSSLAMTVAVLIAPTASAEKSPASRYGVINGTVNAATVHEVAGSSAFPNFTTGAVDNYYSMAHSHVDNAPFAEGTSSPADTGPIGQTAAATHFQQPQYADARWPDKNSGQAAVGKQGGPYAVASASDYKATAQCSEASNGASAPGFSAPKGFSQKLSSALAAWKAKWLVPLKLKAPATPVPKPRVPVTVPTVPSVPTPTVPTPTVPTPTVSVPLPTSKTSASTTASSSNRRLASAGDGGALFESSSLATVDPGSGDVVTKGESSLGRVSLGKGQIVIQSINVSVTVTNDGTPAGKVAVNVGAASIGGVPVTIDQDGVRVKEKGANLPYTKADDSLNAALKKAGIELHTVAPEVTKMPNAQTVTATGVHVAFVQPETNAPGVPAQYVDHILGEVFVDSLAAPAPPLMRLDLGGGTGSTGNAGGGGLIGSGSSSGGAGLGSSSSTGLSGGGAPGSGYSSQPGSSGSAAQAVPASSSVLTSVTRKPVWLLAAYLVWQALVIGTGVSLRSWGMGRPS
ncbi:MAG: hypothetical protein ACJ75L_02115 [Gaiellaceae bacterium]